MGNLSKNEKDDQKNICNNVQLKGVKKSLQKKPSIYLNKGIKKRNNSSCWSDIEFNGATYCMSKEKKFGCQPPFGYFGLYGGKEIWWHFRMVLPQLKG